MAEAPVPKNAWTIIRDVISDATLAAHVIDGKLFANAVAAVSVAIGGVARFLVAKSPFGADGDQHTRSDRFVTSQLPRPVQVHLRGGDHVEFGSFDEPLRNGAEEFVIYFLESDGMHDVYCAAFVGSVFLDPLFLHADRLFAASDLADQDPVVGDLWQFLAGSRELYVYCWTSPYWVQECTLLGAALSGRMDSHLDGKISRKSESA